MISLAYEICLIISFIIIIYIATRNYDKIDIYYCTMMMIIPVVILGYWLQTRVTTAESSVLTFCFIYLDSTVLLMVTFFSMLRSFDVTIRPWMKIVGYGTAFGHCMLVWQCFGTDLYYATVQLYTLDGMTITKVTSGPLKFIHVIYLGIILVGILAAILCAYIRKGTFSRKTLMNYAFACLLGIFTYAAEMFLDADFTILPFLYVLVELLIAIDYDKIHTHDISTVISEQQKSRSTKGYFALDFNRKFLGCNERAKDFFEFLKNQREDECLPKSEGMFLNMIDDFKDTGKVTRKFKVNEVTCVCEISEFSTRKDGTKQGYLFELRDATEEQRILDVMEEYNTTLNTEVREKTESIAAIQQKIVVGMANIIENRDNNTGGHVKRTSDVMLILVEELMREGKFDIDRTFATDIVRAAPMHDLGKVSIDSSILCKPARLTPEEYEIMKSHSVKSADMVTILLDGVEEERFVNVAYNVALYHHERWDGKGYPEGLVGSMIPLEARIMAIADVYDALVSKRCYKEPMSFEQARNIMCEGMGTQFDPNLKNLFLNCEDKLVAYYKTSK